MKNLYEDTPDYNEDVDLIESVCANCPHQVHCCGQCCGNYDYED